MGDIDVLPVMMLMGTLANFTSAISEARLSCTGLVSPLADTNIGGSSSSVSIFDTVSYVDVEGAKSRMKLQGRGRNGAGAENFSCL